VSRPALGARIFAEHRRAIIVLAAAFLLNVVGYVALVLPLSQRVANVAQRNEAAAVALASARREFALESGTVSGKARASQELNTFYSDVLPADIAGARRMTHLRLAQLAREAGLRLDDRSFGQEDRRKGSLARLQITMNLAGSYSAFRTFVHELESSPEFVVIDNVELSEEAEGDSQLKVRLDLSTYFRNAAS
jgi:Tfp pilus assembly protein PilO